MQKENADTDERYMRRALELARKGEGHVNPNPMVGAVIVKEGHVIGEGFHEYYGGLHAERNALKQCKESPEGATLYVTLEPCCHYGKTPPCTQIMIESGIKRAVIGTMDLNPIVSGKGAKALKEAGIQITTGILEKECKKLNEIFWHFIMKGEPYVVMKYAMTIDGKIATSTGESKWITGEEARKKVQEDRGKYMAIMAGIGTVLADDPLLTCRLEGKRSPIRIICDSRLRTPLKSRLVETAGDCPLIIATACTDKEKQKPYIDAGCEIMELPLYKEEQQKAAGLDLRLLRKELGRRSIDSLLLEGGGTLNEAALKQGIVNKVQAYIAPKIFGGAKAKTPVEGEGISIVSEAVKLKNMNICMYGEDILVEAEVNGE